MTVLEEKLPANKKIKIKKVIKTSLLDWEGMIVSTLYVDCCNFRCPFCYNVDLIENPPYLPAIPEEDILSFLKERKLFLDGICLSGGEPTIYNDLPQFLKKIKNEGLKIKLDTNGSNPERLADIIKQNLVDYIAMDIKNYLQPDVYLPTIGVKDNGIITNIKKSIELIMHTGIEYEFRTTVVPLFHDETAIMNIAREIKGAKQYVLQNFINSEKLLDPNLKKVNPYSTEKITELVKKAAVYVENCKKR